MEAIQKELKNSIQMRERSENKLIGEIPPDGLKVTINEFLWSNLPGNIRINAAEDLSYAIYSVICQLYEGKTLKQIANGD